MIRAVKRKIERKLPKNKFVRAVGVLAGGTALSQAIVIASAPILTRIYDPEDFGLLAIYTSILAIFTIIASFRYEMAIPLPKDDESAEGLVTLSFLVVLLMTGVSALTVWFWGGDIAAVMKAPLIEKYIWLLPIGLFFSGTYQVLNYFAIRKKEFSILAVTRLQQAIGTVATQGGGGIFGPIGLLLGQVIGQGIGIRRLSCLLSKNIKRMDWIRLFGLAKQYKKFPIFTTWASLVNTVGQQMPALVIASLLGPAYAGLYALSNRVIMLPVRVLGGAISNVFLSNAAEEYRAGDLSILVEKTFLNLIKLILPATLFLGFFSTNIFVYVFGEEWIESGKVAAWLSFWVLFSFSVSPISIVFNITGQQSLGLAMQLIMMLFRVGGLWIGYVSGDFIKMVAMFSLSNAAGYLVYLMVILHVAKSRKIMALSWGLTSLALTFIALGGANYVERFGFFYCLVVFSLLAAFFYFYTYKKVRSDARIKR